MHPAYLAGIIDGEGSIMLVATGKQRFNGMPTCFCPRVQIANTNLDLLYAIQGAYGGVIKRSAKPKNKDVSNHRDGYQLRFHGVNAVSLIKIAYPYLIVKRAVADIVLEFAEYRETNRPKAFGGNGIRRGWQYDEEQVRWFNDAATEVKRLNKRGLK